MANTRRKEQLGIALEATPGTAVAPTHYIPFLECSLEEKLEIISDNQAKGRRLGEGSDAVEGKKSGEGKIEVVLDPDTAPYWLALAFGAIESAPDGDNFAHTCELSEENDPLTASIWRDRVVDAVQFVNAVVDTLELTFADDVAKLSMDIKSKYPAAEESPGGAGVIAAEQNLNYYTFRNAKVEIGEATIKVKEFSLKVENEAEVIYAPGSNDVDRIVVKTPKVSGSFTLLFESLTQKAAFEGLTKNAMVITFTGDGDDEIVITIPQFRVDKWNQGGGIDDISEETIEFIAEDANESPLGAAITAVVTNGVEKYISKT